MLAQIEWLTEKEGGRLSPPSGPRYITVARFADEKEKYPAEAWSLVLEFKAPSDDPQSMIAEVHFLANDAPTYLLYNGSLFELFEGRKLVARGRICKPPLK